MSFTMRTAAAWLGLVVALGLAPLATPALARESRSDRILTPAAAGDIEHAIDERRFIDAGTMLDTAMLSGVKDPRLILLSGKLDLARSRYDQALTEFRQVEALPAVRADALEGQGLALALSGRTAEALPVLKKTVAEFPGQWRAWNALGGAYDEGRDWTDADDAYAHALAASDAPAMVINNRGYSRLLRNQLDEAAADFVEALRQRPDMEAARTNLRLAMALKGEYGRATAGGDKASEAALLNNAGFAALLRGDYARAESLLQQAIQRKGEYYDLAQANLDLVRQSKARVPTDVHDAK